MFRSLIRALMPVALVGSLVVPISLAASEAPSEAHVPTAMLSSGIDAAARLSPEALTVVAGTTYTTSGSCYWKRTTGYYNYTPRVAVWALNSGCWQVEAYIHYGVNQPGCPAYTYTGWHLMGTTGNETILVGQHNCGATYVDLALYDSRGYEYAWYREWF